MKRLLIFAGTAVMLLVAGGFAAAGPQPPLYFAAESEVSAEDIEDGAVTSPKIADGAVTTSKLHAEALNDITKQGGFSKLGVGMTGPIGAATIRVGTDNNLEFAENSGEIRINTSNNARSVDRPLRFNASEFNFLTGNVGIGTVSPATHLHIADSTATSAKLTIGDTDSAACIMLRDTDAAGWTECNALNGTLSCTTDADGVCDGS